MRTMLAALALAGLAWGCEARAESPAPQEKKAEGLFYTATVKIDDV